MMSNTVTARIKEFNEGLLPDMLALKYKAMAESPFRFFRGSCHLFYEDLSRVKNFPVSPLTWICGDLHLENFGSFKGNNREVYFDLNDFDESMLAPLNWEMVRMLSSIYVAFDSFKLSRTLAEEMASLFMSAYVARLKNGKAGFIDPRTARGVVRTFLENAALRKEKEMIKKNTDGGQDQLSIKINNETHFPLEKSLKKDLIVHITKYLAKSGMFSVPYEVKDAVFRLAGTGSMGLKRYLLLLQNTAKPGKLMFLDVKQAMKSSLLPFNKVKQPEWESEALRICTTKYNMQNVSPALLSHLVFNDDDFVIQELQPSADKINLAKLEARVKDFKNVIQDMAMLTASAQLRSSGIKGSANHDELNDFAFSDADWNAVQDYARAYAAQVIKDYESYLAGQ
ncbi:DUF2252 domain-containing protein [Pedobacter gandavensis]|uniref:DUF2252 domain-containing protein n=1 Tax=Pedobacter gandavensis TaxID=2679963 RepID=UPI00292F09B1|nr:DUF2252 family protein [Pedobacter gandavensis]